MLLSSGVNGMVCSSLELKQKQTQAQNKLSGGGVTLALGSNRGLR